LMRGALARGRNFCVSRVSGASSLGMSPPEAVSD